MPLFPMPPLKFRTAGFPQYGFKPGSLNRSLPLKVLGLNAIPISTHPPNGLLQPSSDYSRSMAIRSYCVSATLAVSSNHPAPEALRIGRVLLSLPILAHTTSSACLIDSSRFPFRLYARSLAFLDSSCLPIRLSPLYLHISHRLPPPLRRGMYQVLLPIPSLLPSAFAVSKSAWHSLLFPLQSASCGSLLRRCSVRIMLRPPVLLSPCADLDLPYSSERPNELFTSELS